MIKHRFLAALAATTILISPAAAANLALKAPAAPAASGYPAISGMYFGLYSEAGAGSAVGTDTSVINSNTGKIFDASADFGGILGYVRCTGTDAPAMPNIRGVCYSVEGAIGWQNLNAQSTGISITGPLVVHLGGSVATPLSNIISWLPNFNLFGNLQTPGLPGLPSGVSAGAGTLGIYGGMKAQDVSGNFNVGSLKAWSYAFEIGPEMRWRLSNQMAVLARTTYVSPSATHCIVAGKAMGCEGLGAGVFQTIAFEY